MYFTVHTWQTKPHKEDKGIVQAVVNRKIKDENVGHAAMTLVLPVNEETIALVEKYCGKMGEKKATIPYYIVHHEVKKADLGASVSTIKANDTSAYSNSEFHIYFSFWPSTNDKHFLSSPISDGIDERKGRNFFDKKRNKDLVSSSDISFQEIKNKRGKVVKRYALSPTIELKRDQSLYEQKKDNLDDIKNDLEEIISIIYPLASIQLDKEEKGDVDGDYEEKVKAIAKGIDSGKIEQLAKDLEKKLKHYFPDLDVGSDFSKIKKIDLDNVDSMEIIDIISKYHELIESLNNSLPYYAELFIRTKGDYGDNTQTVSIPEKEGLIDVEAMLQAMVVIAEEEVPYSLLAYNCSSAVAEVVRAGIQNDQLEAAFSSVKHKLLPNTPQILMRNTRSLSSAVTNEEFLARDKIPQKKIPQESSPVTRSMAIVVKKLDHVARKTQIETIERDFSSTKRGSKTKNISAEELLQIADKMISVLSEDKTPVIDAELSGLIENKYREIKNVKRKSSKDQRFLEAYDIYKSQIDIAYSTLQAEQKEVRRTALTEREQGRFLKLISSYAAKPNKQDLELIEKELCKHPEFKKLKIEGESVAVFAKKQGLKKLEKLVSTKKKKKENSPIIISLGSSTELPTAKKATRRRI